jgi:hypothetical protein
MDETTRRLHDEVVRRTQGTPYVVTPTARGFDVALDIADNRWFELFGTAGLSKVYTHHVVVDGQHVTLTDDNREVRWDAGVPVLAGSAKRSMGRSIEFSFEKTWALGGSGRLAKVVDYTFSSEEGRRIIEGAIKELGLDERMPWVAKGPLILAIGVLVLLALSGVVMGVYGLVAWLS